MKFSEVKTAKIPEGPYKKIKSKGHVLWNRAPLYNYVSLGDSIAAGHEIDENWYKNYGRESQYGANGNTATAIVPNSYTDLIRSDLATTYGADEITAVSFAQSGDQVSHLLAKLDHDVVKKAIEKANLVTICIGANDVLTPALSKIESYINTGNPALVTLGKEVDANLAILNDDTNANSYKALFDKLYAINPTATYVFTNVYNPLKYLWLDESTEEANFKDGFFGDLIYAIPGTTGAISNDVRYDLVHTNASQAIFDRINGPSRNGTDGLAAWTETYVSKLNKVIKDKITAYGKPNFKVIDTKSLFESFPDRPVTANIHYNDLVNVEFTRGYKVSNLDWSKFWDNFSFSDITDNMEETMSTILTNVVTNVIAPGIDPHPATYGQYAMKRAFIDALGWESLSRYTLAYNGNGGSGSMASRTVLGIDSIPAYTTLDANAFTSPTSGRYFGTWNTAANGGGTSYANKQVVGLTSSVTLYAQWAGEFTLTYRKVYNMDFPGEYPPASNSGPVSKDGSEYYLRVTVNGEVLDGLNDYFTETDDRGRNVSPTRTLEVPADAELYIQLINKYSGDLCAVYVNDVLVAGITEYCYYTTKVTQDMEMEFTWDSEGVININAQSYWVCHIYT